MDLVDPVLYLDEALVIGLTELVVFRGMAPSIFFLFFLKPFSCMTPTTSAVCWILEKISGEAVCAYRTIVAMGKKDKIKKRIRELVWRVLLLWVTLDRSLRVDRQIYHICDVSVLFIPKIPRAFFRNI